jgi:hypothetical protein
MQSLWEKSDNQSFDENGLHIPYEDQLLTIFFEPNSLQQLTDASNNNNNDDDDGDDHHLMVNLITKDQVVVEIGKLLSELLSPTISDH